MRCPNCATENTSRAKFCQECGKRLPLVCADCGHEIAAGAKFCVNCGHPVTAAPAAGPPVSEPHGPDADRPAKSGQNAERRQLTVLFSDLVGSTALSERLDPEDYRELIAHYRSTVADIVGQYGGQVANFVGDGIVVYFGYPVAQEGSAYAAAITALEITEAAPGIAECTKTPELSNSGTRGLAHRFGGGRRDRLRGAHRKDVPVRGYTERGGANPGLCGGRAGRHFGHHQAGLSVRSCISSLSTARCSTVCMSRWSCFV